MSKRSRLTVSTGLIIAVAAGCSDRAIDQDPVASVESKVTYAFVSVDLAQDRGAVTHAANGQLVGIWDTAPSSDGVLTPIRPTTHRADNNAFARAYARLYPLGTRNFQQVLTFNFDRPYDFQKIGDGKSVSLATWYAWVYDTVRTNAAQGRVVDYDIVNEPDLSSASFEDVVKVWSTAYRAIRAANPSARIVGPSIAYPDQNLRPWLARLHADGVFPDVVSYHLYTSPGGIAGHVNDVRAYLNSIGMGNRPISLNEIIADGIWPNAGYVAGNLIEAERAGVESAHHACWSDPRGGNNCNNSSLNGLLDVDGVSRRAGWWVYKGYADVAGRAVAVTSSQVWGMAGLDAGAGSASMLLGKYAYVADDTMITVQHISAAPYLVQNNTVHVHAERIPNTGVIPLSSPTVTVEADVPVNGDQIQFGLPGFGGDDAYTVRLTRGGGGGAAGGGAAGGGAAGGSGGAGAGGSGGGGAEGCSFSGQIVGIGGKAVEVVGSANGSAVRLGTGSGGENQKWTAPGDGTLRAYGKCLDMTGYDPVNGAPLLLWDCVAINKQRWTVNSNGTITGLGGKCVDAAGASSANGTALILWDCHGAANQKWQICR